MQLRGGGDKITKDEINPVAKREKERVMVVVVVVVVKKHERMNGGTKVARTYQPDIVGSYWRCAGAGQHCCWPLFDRGDTLSGTEGYRRRRGPASFSESRGLASVTYSLWGVACATGEGFQVGAENQPIFSHFHQFFPLLSSFPRAAISSFFSFLRIFLSHFLSTAARKIAENEKKEKEKKRETTKEDEERARVCCAK